jgi:hypothetical protein
MEMHRMVTSPAKDTYLVVPELSMGQTQASGTAIYRYSNGTWLCERCGTPQGTSREDCDEVKEVKEWVKGIDARGAKV